MGKIRLALGTISLFAALLSNTAHGQSSVQLYGVVGVTVGSFKHSGGPVAAIQEGSGGITTSFWGIRGTEDIGSGNKVFFVLESFFQPANGAIGRTSADSFFARNANVGIASATLGKITLGRQTDPFYSNEQIVNPFIGSSAFSPLIVQTYITSYGGQVLGDTGWNNGITYTSPTIGGFTGTAVYAPGGLAGAAGVANVGLHATYVNGPFQAVFSGQRLRQLVNGSVTNQQTTWLGGATYDFNIVKLYGAAVGTTVTGLQIETHTYEGGFSIPVFSIDSIRAEYARTLRENAPSEGPRTFRTTATIAYDHLFSKRSDIYLLYMYDKASNSFTANEVAVGLRHAF